MLFKQVADAFAASRQWDSASLGRLAFWVECFGDCELAAVTKVDGRVAIIWNDNSNVVDPLTPAECQDFQTRPTDLDIQGRLNSGALDQDAFVAIDPSPPGL